MNHLARKIESIYTMKVRWLLLLTQLVLLYFPVIQIFSIPTDNGSIPASICYFFSLVFAPWLVLHLKELRLPHWSVFGLFLLVYAIAIFRMPKYGLSKSILHWAFGLYLIVIVLNVGRGFQKKQWLRLLEIAACIFAISHLLYMLWNHETVTYLLHGYYTRELDGTYGAKLPSLTRGGRNLDATWLALGGFFVTGRKKAFYVTYSILFSCLGASRVGMIATACLILWSLVYDKMYRLNWKKLKWYTLYACGMLLVLTYSGLAVAGFGRFSAILPFAPSQNVSQSTSQSAPNHENAEDGTMDIENFLSGRAAMWSRAPQMFRDNPWGYGVGNALRVMKQSYGFTSYEDVIHNVFLQLLLDEGFLGGIWYIGLAAAFLYSQRKNLFLSPFAAYFLTYLILSAVQFHGGEALMQFTLAVFLAERNGWFFVPWSKKQNRESGEAKNGAFKNIADHP